MESAQAQRVIHNEVTSMAAHSAGTQSKTFKMISEMPQHNIAVAISGAPTGIFSVRARPVGGQGFTKVAIEGIDLSTEEMLSWSITGFYDAFALVVTTGIASGSIQLVVSSCTEGL